MIAADDYSMAQQRVASFRLLIPLAELAEGFVSGSSSRSSPLKPSDALKLIREVGQADLRTSERVARRFRAPSV